MVRISFYKETNFKDTEIGKIPEDWKIEKLGNYIENFIRGISYKQSEANKEKKPGFIPLLRATNLLKNKIILNNLIFIPEKKVKKVQLIKKGDIIITTSSGSKNLVGRAIYVGEDIKQPITIGAFLAIIRNKISINNIYFYFLFESSFYRKRLNNLSSGTNINNLKKDFILDFKIPFPSLKEQKAIAKVLKDFDDLLKIIYKQIEKLKRIKKGLMNEYFTKGIFKHEKFKDTEIGRIPEDWKVVRLDEKVDILDKYRIPLKEQERKEKKGVYPYCGANGIIDYINEYIFDGEYIMLAEDGGYFDKFEKSAYLMKGKFWANNHVHILQAKNGLINLFLYYSLIYLDLTSYVVGSTRKKLNQSALKSIKIPLPSLEEQKAIAERLKAIDDLIETKQKEKEHLERAKKKVMDLLLSGKVRTKTTNWKIKRWRK